MWHASCSASRTRFASVSAAFLCSAGTWACWHARSMDHTFAAAKQLEVTTLSTWFTWSMNFRKCGGTKCRTFDSLVKAPRNWMQGKSKRSQARSLCLSRRGPGAKIRLWFCSKVTKSLKCLKESGYGEWSWPAALWMILATSEFQNNDARACFLALGPSHKSRVQTCTNACSHVSSGLVLPNFEIQLPQKCPICTKGESVSVQHGGSTLIPSQSLSWLPACLGHFKLGPCRPAWKKWNFSIISSWSFALCCGSVPPRFLLNLHSNSCHLRTHDASNAHDTYPCLQFDETQILGTCKPYHLAQCKKG